MLLEKDQLQAPFTMPPVHIDGQEADPREPVGPTDHLGFPLRYSYRRAFSEMELLDAFGDGQIRFEKGMCHNFLTQGDVDALSFLKAVIRAQRVGDCIVSTWCVDMNDVKQLRKWLDDGRIGHLQLFLGEIYVHGRHGFEVSDYRKIFDGCDNVRLVVARNHSKIMCGRGESFDFLIQTSANINTNPRIESTCLIIPPDESADEMFAFYADVFKNVKNINSV